MIQKHESIDVFIGVDVGKTNHHAVAINRAGKKRFDKDLPQDEAQRKDLIHSLPESGTLLLVVDQPATIGALPVAVAQAAGLMPEALRTVEILEQHVAEPVLICGFDDDPAKQTTATSNRLRGLLMQIHPALEMIIGKYLDRVAMTELLAKYPMPA